MKKNITTQKKIFNYIMVQGQKEISENNFLKSFKRIQKNYVKKNTVEIIKLALANTSPFFQIKSLTRKKRKSIEFPFLLHKRLKVLYGIKNILKHINVKKSLPFYKKLTIEVLNAAKLNGLSIKKKLDLHEYAFKKKKYARYRWF